MVRLIPSKMFIKDPVDYWGQEHTIGNAELAARLGSPVTFDRRGTVWWYDTFDNASFPWKTSLSGTGAAATLSNEYPHMGEGCVKITTGDGLTDYAQIERFIGSVTTSRVGIAAIVHFQTSVNVAAVLAMRIITGTRNIGAAIRIQQPGIGAEVGGLSYGNSTGSSFHTTTEFTPFNTDYYIYAGASYPIKFVVDVENEKYVRCMFGGDEIDMSGYTPYAIDYTNSRRLQPLCGVVANDGAASNMTAYFDNVVITVDEPA